MTRRTRDDSLVQRILARALRTRVLWLLWLVPWLIGATRQIGNEGTTVYQPYALFDASFAGLYGAVAAVLAAFWVGWTIAAAATTRDANATSGILFDSGLLAVHLLFFWFFFALGFDSLNALLDFSAKREIAVYVQETHEVHWRDKSGGKSSKTVATVNLVGRPNERIRIGWNGCKLPSEVVPSPFVSLRVGPGAFGFPWLADPECHALRVDELPLVQDFFLGRGDPAVIVTLSSRDATNPYRRFVTRVADELTELRAAADPYAVKNLLDNVRLDAEQAFSPEDRSRLLDLLRSAEDAEHAPVDAVDRAIAFVRSTDQLSQPAYTAPRWLATIQQAWPGVRTVWMYEGESPTWLGALDCRGCRTVPASLLDGRTSAIFFEGEQPWQTSHLYVADGTGKRVFSAALRDLGRREELMARLTAMRPAPK
jgi:hypothetical protein